MMNALVKHIWLVSLQCLMVKLVPVSLESTTSVPGFTTEFPLNLIGFCKGAQRNIVLKMSCVIGEYVDVVKYIHFVFNSLMFIHTKNVHENSPKVSTRIHPLKMSTRIRLF